MQYYLILAALLHFCFAAQQAPAWETKSSTGRMRLVGTSFGVSGRNATFDYVIVGGGTAGLTVANRLAEHFTVAVIEAGSFYEIDNGNISQVPGSTFSYETGASFLTDWNINTEPVPGYDNRTLHYSRGRTLGGSSALNDQAYQRPTIGAMNKWAKTVDDDSWSWDRVLPFYKKSVNFTGPDLDGYLPEVPISYEADAYSSHGGPLKVTFQPYQQPLTAPAALGFERIGLQKTRGESSGELLGWSFPAVSHDPEFQTRSSSETSFLQETIERHPTAIQVYQQALAKRIIFNDARRATGVDVTVRGSIEFKFTLSARKEVILCAGAFQSPQILMVSGVGPAADLQEHDIKVIADRPGVGQNLQDQPWLLTTYKVNVITGSELSNNGTYAADAVEEYLDQQNGPLTNIGADILGWEKLPKINRGQLSRRTIKELDSYPSDWPEIEFVALADPTAVVPDDGGQYATFSFFMATFSSRGSVGIVNNDTSTLPLVRVSYLATEADREVAVQGFKRTRQWAEASGAAVEEIAPGKAVQSREEILQYMAETGSFGYHASCTCAMGRPEDPKAVVDTHARVYGVSGLRVVDASIFPFLPPGHPQATVYMVAEKIAHEIIREEIGDLQQGSFDGSHRKPLGVHADL